MSDPLLTNSTIHVTGIIPQSDHRVGKIMFVAQYTQARRAQEKISTGRRLETKPARGQHAQEMRTREK